MIKKIKINIWNRGFELPIEYDCFSNEKVTDSQINALNVFLKDKALLDKAKISIEDYCKKDLDEDKENKNKDNKNKDNIFTYIIPHYIYVKRDEKPRVALMCKYKYDMEHGLAVVFHSNGKIEVGLQDIIL